MKSRTFRLNKLVRDKIVRHSINMGGQVKYTTLTGNKLNQALIQKLIEEAKELKSSAVSAAELADLQEILDQLAKNLKLSPAELKKLQSKKIAENGGFAKGHYIKTVTLAADNKWAQYYAADPQRFPEIKND